jgi:hypothetical protein
MIDLCKDGKCMKKGETAKNRPAGENPMNRSRQEGWGKL